VVNKLTHSFEVLGRILELKEQEVTWQREILHEEINPYLELHYNITDVSFSLVSFSSFFSSSLSSPLSSSSPPLSYFLFYTESCYRVSISVFPIPETSFWILD
jgi:hypothetical protein